jgi:hypothetical protein
MWKALSTSDMRREQSEYRAPSWSWASIDGPIEFDHTAIIEDIQPHDAKIGFCKIIAAPDQFGQISAGNLSVEGLMIPVFLKETDGSGNEADIVDGIGEFIGKATLDFGTNTNMFHDLASSSKQAHFHSLHLNRDGGLLLRRT